MRDIASSLQINCVSVSTNKPPTPSHISHSKMTKGQNDEISSFFGWKSNIEKNEVPRVTGDRGKRRMTVSDLSRRLSVSTMVSDSITARGKPSDPRQKMPPNREVDLISKVKKIVTSLEYL